jgi:hypothetical protein
MPLTIKHKADGTFYEQGDTQGLMIPEDLPLAKIVISSTTYTANSGKPLNLGNFSQTQPFVEKSGNALVIKEDGLYLIDFGAVIQSATNASRVYYININSVERKSISYDGGASGNMATPVFLVDLRANDTVEFEVYTAVANTFTQDDYNPIRICQLKRNAPYMIANKGALVSGGGFQFDEDGNGYTKNYSQNEIVVGKWINGKTIYSRTIGPFNLPALAPSATYNLSNPIPTGTIDRLTYSELNANGAMLYANVYSFNSANIIIMNTTQLTWVPYNNCYLTAQYTKV